MSIKITWDSILNVLGFGRTETEKKRDQYKKLHDKLTDALSDHNEKASEAESSYNAYISSVPNLSNTKIPSNDFDSKREEINDRLLKDFQKDKDMRQDLLSAKNKAFEKYEYYRDLAISEAKAEASRREAEREREEREKSKS